MGKTRKFKHISKSDSQLAFLPLVLGVVSTRTFDFEKDLVLSVPFFRAALTCTMYWNFDYYIVNCSLNMMPYVVCRRDS
jgi:hypothetical protein